MKIRLGNIMFSFIFGSALICAITSFDWRWWLYLAISIVIGVLIAFFIPPKPQ